MDSDGHGYQLVAPTAEFTPRVNTNRFSHPYYNDERSHIFDKDLAKQFFFFLSLRGTSGERIEERGIRKNQDFETRLLSPALSSIGWRRGSGCGHAALCLFVCIRGLEFHRLKPTAEFGLNRELGRCTRAEMTAPPACAVNFWLQPSVRCGHVLPEIPALRLLLLHHLKGKQCRVDRAVVSRRGGED